ncbi:zinc-binding alcohol dehydrogenase family protein [Hylemonella sp. W303a]|uniref:zinc-binding alcohol dehydrogenase family protein n=1 Tax=Hylemonella sp. W303a TaxID=3389873 RepID=UPI00396B3B7A
MKAIAYQHALPIQNELALQDRDLPEPMPGPRDLLVEVKAISVNPVDTKMRAGAQPEPGQWRVLGWDASGIVRDVGGEVRLFKPGDRVWYAGDIRRPGSNSELHVVDERLVGHAPYTLDHAQAAAMPLTTITAWELMFDRLRLRQGAHAGESLLVIGAAGGVGSILVQLARQLTKLNVIGTASRPETSSWVQELGAHHVIDHGQPLAQGLKAQGLEAPQYVVSLTHSDAYLPQITELIAPQGRFGLIDDPDVLDIGPLKKKSVSVHWELMFTRSMFGTTDMQAQHELLTQVALLVDAGRLRTTVGEHLGRIDATNLRRAHALVEAGHTRGKLVLEGF